MNIPWDVIIPMVIELIQECMNNGVPESEVRSQFRQPRGLARLRVERQIRNAMHMGPLEWRRQRGSIMPEVYAEAAKADEADVAELITLAQATD